MAPVTVETHEFATVGETTLGLDLYRAPQTDAPLVLYVHGGGWRSGDKADARTERLAPLAGYGVTVASVDYRLVPGAAFPDQVHDLKQPSAGSAATHRLWAYALTGWASGVPRPEHIWAHWSP